MKPLLMNQIIHNNFIFVLSFSYINYQLELFAAQ